MAAVDQANAVALQQILRSDPVWADVQPAGDLIPELGPGVLLHSGPPLSWAEMPGCTRGAVAAVMIYEGWARSVAEAEARAARGEVQLVPGHGFGVVSPVAGVVGPSMPLMVVKDRANGTMAFSPLNEGRGRVVRYGACDDQVIARLRWLGDELVPLFRQVLHQTGGIPFAHAMMEAVHMGDELHNRNKAFTRTMLGSLAVGLVRAGASGAAVARAMEFLADTDVFFLCLSMPACKAALRSIEGIPWCSLASVMSQNGHQFGIQVAGLPGRWFTAPAPMVEGQYFEHWTAADACPAIGDSIITETAGLGAFVLAAAPALVRYIGGTPEAAVALNEKMYAITVGENPRYTIPALGFRGAPTGIDIRKVAASGQSPVTNAGIAHREAGIGQIGAGYIRTPPAVFQVAWQDLQDSWTGQAGGDISQ